MEWIETPESSNVTRIGYDADAQTLDIEFKSGMSYRYFDVPDGVFQQMKTAPSKGQFVAQTIKGVFRYARL